MPIIWNPFSWSNKPRPDVADGSQSIFTRLTTRFRLTDDVPAAPVPSQLLRVGKTVVPMTDMDELLKMNVLTVIDNNITLAVNATGWYNIMSVPPGKRRRVHSVSVQQYDGTFTLKLLAIDNQLTNSLSLNYITIKQITPGILFQYFPIDNCFDMEQGWGLFVYVDSKAVNGHLSGSVFYKEEDAY